MREIQEALRQFAEDLTEWVLPVCQGLKGVISVSGMLWDVVESCLLQEEGHALEADQTRAFVSLPQDVAVDTLHSHTQMYQVPV